jgi:hypothetical protein
MKAAAAACQRHDRPEPVGLPLAGRLEPRLPIDMEGLHATHMVSRQLAGFEPIPQLALPRRRKKRNETSSAVAQWELPNGTRPTTDHLVVIAQRTGVLLEWLATGRGAESPGGAVCTQAEVFDIARNDVESRVLEAMRRLSRAKQELVLKMVRLLLHD